MLGPLAAIFLALVFATLATAQSIQVTQVTTTVGGVTATADNLPTTVFQHDLSPPAEIVLTTVAAGFSATNPVNVISILEDGVVVRILGTGQGDFPNSISYTPTSPGAKTLTVSATNGTTTRVSSPLRVNVFGIAITAPADGTAAPVGSDLFISGPTLVRNGIVASVEFFVDGVSVGTDSNAPYAVAWRPTVAGAYTLNARLTASDLTTTDSPDITFTVIPAVANGTMSVALVSPANGRTEAAGSAVTLTATATLTGSLGRVEQVQFYVDGIAVGTAVAAFPFTTTWTPTLAGPHVLTAIATDDKSNAVASAPVTVNVTGNIPAIVLTAPADGASVAAGSGVTLTAAASGQDGTTVTVQSVDFLVDGNLVGSAATAPYAITWTPSLARAVPYVITARVTATNTAVVTSAPVSVTVTTSGGINPPTIALSPGTVFSLPAGARKVISAAATANAGRSIQRVEFFLDGVKVGEDTTAPYNFLLLAPLALGSHTLLARATDSANIAAEASVTVEITLAYGQSPAVTLQLPAAGGTFAVGSPVNLSAVATDSDGTIQSVVFLANNEPVLNATAVPYAGVFYPQTPGTVILGALATDNSGQTTLASTTITVIGQPQGTPSVTLVSPNAASATVMSGQRIVFEATAASGSADAFVSRVEFLVNGFSLGTDGRQVGFSNAYRVDEVVITAPGTYTIKARVTDSRGVAAESPNSQVLTVQSPVGAAPTVSIASPQLPAGGDLTITNLSTLPLVAVATDADGTVSDVEFYVDRGERAKATATITQTRNAQGQITRSHISAIAVAQAGEGYLVKPDVLIEGDGVGAVAEVSSLDANRGVAGVNVLGGGDNYTVAAVRLIGGGLYEAQSIGHAVKDPAGLGWRLNAQPGLLGAGPYRLYAVARDNAGNQTASSTVRFVVTGATTLPPSITLTSDVTSITSGHSVNLSASAFDPDGTVASVEFFANATSIGKVTTGTFAQSWAPVSPGTYLLTAVATDNSGNTTVANTVTLAVTGAQPNGLPPVVTILVPPGTVTVSRLSSYLFTAFAFDPDDSVASVEFYRDGVSMGTATRRQASSNYSLTANFAAVQTGIYQVTAIARDITGNATTSEPVTVTVVTARSLPPTVAVQITQATVTPGELVNLTAAAVDPDGQITGIQFFSNGTAIGAETASVTNSGTVFSSITWSPSVGGSYDIVAIARDNTGNLAVSSSVTVVVSGLGQGPPIVTLVQPSVTGASIISGQRVIFDATANSGRADAEIERVEFLVNGVPITNAGSQVGFSNHYRVTDYLLTAPGVYTIKARATDSRGVAAESSNSQLVTVLQPTGAAPSVTMLGPQAPASGGITVNSLSSLPLVALAADADGTVGDVEFFVDRGRRPTVTAEINRNPVSVREILAVSITDPGEGYLSIPKIVIYGDGVGAAAVVSALDGNQGVGRITMTQGGSGYFAAYAAFIGGGLYEAESLGHAIKDPGGLGWRLSVQPGLLGNGPYFVYAVARDNAGNQTVSTKVRVVVTGSTSLPPTVTLASSATITTAGQPVNLTATAVDPDGTIANVEFFANATSLGKVTTGTFAQSWTPATPGTYLLTAVATDNSGNTSVSNALTLTVNGANATGFPPNVTILNPAGATTVTTLSAYVFTALAFDPDGTVASVEFYRDGVSMGTAAREQGTANFRLAYGFSTVSANAPGAAYQITAIARDNAGNATVSAPVPVTVESARSQAPTVTVQASQTTSHQGDPVTLTALAVDADGSIAGVRFFANGIALGPEIVPAANSGVSSTPLTWVPAVSGSYNLVALVRDSTGNTAVSAPITLTVTLATPTGLPPVVTILNPSGAVTVSRLSTYLFSALAFDPDGTIASVEFFRDGVSMGGAVREQASSNYRLAASFSAVPAGAYQITAIARDNAGNATTSDPVALTVVAARSLAPTVTVQANQTAVSPGELVTLSATAIDSDGQIIGIQFFANGTAIGAEFAPPANTGTSFSSATWAPSVGGSYNVIAMARDSTGNLGVSAAVTVVVSSTAQGVPTVTLTKPNGATAAVVSGQRIIFEATAAPGRSDTAVERVEFLLNGQPLASDGRLVGFGRTYRVDDFVLTAPGTYTVTARVTDSRGVTAESANSQVIVVQPPVGAAPAVALISPQSPASGDLTITNLSNLPLIAVATDADGSVSDVEFFVDRGRRAKATAQLASNTDRIASLTVTDPGEGYLAFPTVSIRGSGVGAAAVVTALNATQGVAAVSVTAGGSGYPPATVEFTGGGLYEAESLGHGAKDPGGLGWRLNAQPGLLGTGPYQIYAVARDNAGNQTVSGKVRVVVTGASSLPPSVTLTSSVTATTSGQPVNLSVVAFDPDGAVAAVEYFANATSIGRTTSAPFSQSWTPSTPGTYLLTAIVTDNTGNTTLSNAVTLTITGSAPTGLPPVVTILNPPGLVTVSTLSTYLFSALAFDPDGQIASVEFYREGVSIGTAVREQGSDSYRLPVSFSSTAVRAAPGYAITAVARDHTGNATESAPVIVTVESARSQPPTVTVTAAPATITLGQALTLSASAVDPDGRIAGVQLFANGTAIGAEIVADQVTGAIVPTVTWTPTAGGGYDVVALVRDNTGNYAVSLPAVVTVRAVSPLTDSSAFVIQAYQDLLGRAPTGAELAVSSQLTAGTLTRGQFVANLVSGSGFAPAFQSLLAYDVVVGVWPGYANYLAGVNALRGGTTLAAYAGTLLGSDEYLARYGPLPDLVTVNPGQYARVSAFATQLYQNAFARNPTLAEVQAIFNDVSTVGVNPAVANFLTAKFITVSDATMTARVRVAAMLIGLWRVQPAAAQVNALAAGALVSAADSVLAATGYTGRFFTVSAFPATMVLAPGGAGILTAEVAGNPPFAYQWYGNGSPLPGATQPYLNLGNVTPAQAGNYYVAVSNGDTTLASAITPVTVAAGASRLVNISTRGRVGTGDNVMIVGFVVSEGGGKPLLLRAGGPGLARTSGLGGTLANPVVRLYAGSQFFATNDDWGANTNLAALLTATAQTGAFSFLTGSADSALLLALNGGVYSAVVSGSDGGSGLALAEAYDADPAAGGRVVNLSTRGPVGTGDNVLIAGFVVTGNVSKRVLLRAAGPGLANVSALGGTLRDPRLDLYAGGGRLRGNDNWGAAPEAGALAAAAGSVGAFPLAAGSADAALIVNLAPGVYSAIVSGTAGETGIALVEVYDLDP